MIARRCSTPAKAAAARTDGRCSAAMTSCAEQVAESGQNRSRAQQRCATLITASEIASRVSGTSRPSALGWQLYPSATLGHVAVKGQAKKDHQCFRWSSLLVAREEQTRQR
jgi:hypothetical protein